MLAHVLRECAQSGIEHALVVVSPEKQSVVTFAKSVAGAAGMPARIDTAVQMQPKGLADAVRVGRSFANDEPVAVALPDNLFVDNAQPAVAAGDRDVRARARERRRAHRDHRGHRGSREDRRRFIRARVAGDEFLIESIPSKGAHGSTFDLGSANSAMTGVGRYVFTPAAFEIIDEVERTLAPGKELDDIPVMQRDACARALTGRVLHGMFLDVGLPEGFREATKRLARSAR